MTAERIAPGGADSSSARVVASVSDHAAKFSDMFERLLAAYGPQGWWPGDSPFEIIVGAILTQQTTWGNVEKALSNLKAAGVLSLPGLCAIDEAALAALIRPSGYHNAKALKLKAFVALANDNFDGDLDRMLASPGEELRAMLLSTHGIGPETADSILLYAANRPHFVIDAYLRRTFSRIGITPENDVYDGWQELFTDALPPDVPLFNEYHALIVRHAKMVCRKEPLCTECPLLDVCQTGRQVTSKRSPAPSGAAH